MDPIPRGDAGATRVLLAGWFSFYAGGNWATAGDVLSRDVVAGWLDDIAVPYDVATAPPLTGGVDWREVDVERYTHVVFVCGPFGAFPPLPEFLERFAGRRLIGVGVTTYSPLDVWNPFDLLLERESSRLIRPDVAILSDAPRVPLVGLVRILQPQPEYGARGAHARAHALIDGLLSQVAAAVIPIDTRLEGNTNGFRTSQEVESAIARMDVVVTTRMHGVVLAVKNGVPALAVDPILGGAKVSRQSEALGWPYCFVVNRVGPDELSAAFKECLTPAARQRAEASATRARTELSGVREAFRAEFGFVTPPPPGPSPGGSPWERLKKPIALASRLKRRFR